jgi:hypothetical protein
MSVEQPDYMNLDPRNPGTSPNNSSWFRGFQIFLYG